MTPYDEAYSQSFQTLACFCFDTVLALNYDQLLVLTNCNPRSTFRRTRCRHVRMVHIFFHFIYTLFIYLFLYNTPFVVIFIAQWHNTPNQTTKIPWDLTRYTISRYRWSSLHQCPTIKSAPGGPVN